MPVATRRQTLAALGAAALLPRGALAQGVNQGAAEFPQRAVRIIVPFPAGGSNDITTRQLAEQLRPMWRQPVLVENIPGAGGNVGAANFSRAEPDGHTLLASPPGPLVINRFLYRQLPFDPTRFEPVTVIAKVPNVVVIGPRLGVADLAGLLAAVRQRPGEVTYASQGNGSTSHLTAAMFETLSGSRMVHVPYRGESPALVDIVAGQVDCMFGNMTAALPQHQAGRLRIVAVADRARSSALPEVPTTAEAGLPGLISAAWFALAAPPGTPAPLVARIAADAATGLRVASLRERFRDLGAEPGGEPPAATAAFFAEESERWSAVIRSASVTLD